MKKESEWGIQFLEGEIAYAVVLLRFKTEWASTKDLEVSMKGWTILWIPKIRFFTQYL